MASDCVLHCEFIALLCREKNIFKFTSYSEVQLDRTHKVIVLAVVGETQFLWEAMLGLQSMFSSDYDVAQKC